MPGHTPPEPHPQLPPGGTAQKDEVYYWDTARFLIDGVVFKLPRYHFASGSAYFARTYFQDGALRSPTPDLVDVNEDGRDGDDSSWDSMDVTEAVTPARGRGDGVNENGDGKRNENKVTTTTAGAVPIEGVTASQFRTFLKLLFPIHTTSTTTTLSKPEWLTVLTLSTRWHFPELRKLAIEALHPHMSFGSSASAADLDFNSNSFSIQSNADPDPVEMITLGRAAFVPRWVEDGYERLVTKKGPISEEECGRVGWRAGVRLYIVRHELDRVGVNSDLKGGESARELVREAFEEELGVLRTEERARRTEGEVRIEEEEERRRKRVEEEEARRLKEEEERRAKEEEERRLKEREAQRKAEEEAEEAEREREERERREEKEEEESHRLKETGQRLAKEEEERRLEEEEEKRREKEKEEKAARSKEEHEKRVKEEEEEAQRLKEMARGEKEEGGRRPGEEVEEQKTKQSKVPKKGKAKAVKKKEKQEELRRLRLSEVTPDEGTGANKCGTDGGGFATESEVVQVDAGERDDKERERICAKQQREAERQRREAEREALVKQKLEEELAQLIADTAADRRRRDEERAAKKEKKRQSAAEAKRKGEAAEVAARAQRPRTLMGILWGE